MKDKRLEALKEILATKTVDEAIVLKGKYRDIMLTSDDVEVINRHLSHLQIKRCMEESKGDIPAYAQCVREVESHPAVMPSDHELLLHFGIEELGSPALILDKATARATPCSCFIYKGKDYCWSKGAIGLLKQEQEEIYCVAGKAYKEQPKLVERYTRFAAAAEEAHKKIESMPKGRERLMTWLSAMGEELSKRGIEL